MRKTKTFEGKKHVYDTDKAEHLGSRAFSYYGDPAGYEESLYKTRNGFYFLCGLGGDESPYAKGQDIKPISEQDAQAWLQG
ncbi:MAG: hypothetical protein IJ125_06220 [Atopobiaceae bacterium]|nr:hypothetical protein [Atopobiaceae bacterium]